MRGESDFLKKKEHTQKNNLKYFCLREYVKEEIQPPGQESETTSKKEKVWNSVSVEAQKRREARCQDFRQQLSGAQNNTKTVRGIPGGVCTDTLWHRPRRCWDGRPWLAGKGWSGGRNFPGNRLVLGSSTEVSRSQNLGTCLPRQTHVHELTMTGKCGLKLQLQLVNVRKEKGLTTETACVWQISTYSYQQEFLESCILGSYPTKARVDL